MRDGGIDRNHEIQRADQRGRVREVAEFVVDAQHRRSREQRRVAFAHGLLQTDPVDVEIEQRREPREIDRPVVIVPVLRVARPCNPDPRPAPLAEQRFPLARAPRVGMQIGAGLRNRGFFRAKRVRQAQQRGLAVERRQRFAARDHVGRAGSDAISARNCGCTSNTTRAPRSATRGT